jgi:hypothetical protein
MLAVADPSAEVAVMVTDRVPVTCCGAVYVAEADAVGGTGSILATSGGLVVHFAWTGAPWAIVAWRVVVCPPASDTLWGVMFTSDMVPP